MVSQTTLAVVSRPLSMCGVLPQWAYRRAWAAGTWTQRGSRAELSTLSSRGADLSGVPDPTRTQAVTTKMTTTKTLPSCLNIMSLIQNPSGTRDQPLGMISLWEYSTFFITRLGDARPPRPEGATGRPP